MIQFFYDSIYIRHYTFFVFPFKPPFYKIEINNFSSIINTIANSVFKESLYYKEKQRGAKTNRVSKLLGRILLIATIHIPPPRARAMTNACTNSETNGAWPDLLRVAAMNRHCVARPRGRKTTELCFSPRLAHVKRRAGGRGGEED